MKKFIFYLFLISSMAACQPKEKEQANFAKIVSENIAVDGNKLGDYWYQGKAEINRFTLQQNRYQDVHPGELIMVFVTEDFLTDKQVKNDNYTNPNSISVLKNNRIRKFPTGLYDYSMMTSVFTPADPKNHPHTLKVTSSSQEWCGHTFMQINRQDRGYKMELRSYFESEGDQTTTVPNAILEDELFNRIRIDPQSLPTGKVRVLPSTVVARLAHMEFQPLEASGSLEAYTGEEFEGEKLQVYTLKYAKSGRTFEIIFEEAAPYAIAGWKDSYPSMFDKKIRSTIAKRTHTIMSAYWEKNGLDDMSLRAELGMD